MTLKGDTSRYGALAIGLHWLSAVAILALLALGFTAASTADPARTFSMLQLHVPLGVFVLASTLVRIVWQFIDERPGDPAGQPRWQAVAAHSVHLLLYFVVIFLGTSGIALMALSGAARTLFYGATGPLPAFVPLKPFAVHAVGAFVLTGLLVFHVSAAFYHQIFRRDRLLARMGVGTGG